RSGAAPEEAVQEAFSEVGMSISYTTCILAVGFAIFAFSKFNFIAYFGTLATCIIVLALVADLFLTSAILVLLDVRGERRESATTRENATIGGILLAAGIALAWSGPAVAGPAEDRGLAIMQEQERLNTGFRDGSGQYRMTLVNANGDRSERLLHLTT